MDRAPSRTRAAREGAVAGAVAAAVWAAAEPVAARAFGTRFGDVRLLGRMLGERRGWRVLGLGAHLANGALFGAALGAMGQRGMRRMLAWTALETVATWPAMGVADRVHPDRRSGRWPRLLTSRRVFAQEVVMHGVFALVLGALTSRAGRRSR